MLSEFWVYFQLGFEHISDWAGYDHMLFLLALISIYTFKDAKEVALLITAFTLGHSATLALSTLNVLSVSGPVIEFLIPLTILVTALLNAGVLAKMVDLPPKSHYMLAMGFGMIHGMGFSNYLRALLGADANLVWQLFAFNVGLEMGQIGVVLLIGAVMWVATKGLKFDPLIWSWCCTLLAGMLSVWMLWERNIF